MASAKLAPTATWETISKGVEMRTIGMPSGSSIGGDINVVVLRTMPERLHVVAGSTMFAPQWRQRFKALAAINGGFFDKDGKSMGLRVSGGKKFGSLREADWGVFYLVRRRGKTTANVLHTRDFARKYPNLRRITQAVQCGPRLVVNGRTTTLKPQSARRIGLGVQRDGRVVIALSDGPLTFDEWANLWANKNGLNCLNALNLDGGGSTQISLKAGKTTHEISGSWPVPDAIVLQ